MELQEYRDKINAVDEKLVALFCERMRIAAGIAEYKKERGLPVLDASREAALLERVAGLARERGEDMTAPVTALYERILEVSKEYQSKRIREEN